MSFAAERVNLSSYVALDQLHSLGHIAHHFPVIQGLEDVIVHGAVIVAGAGLDEHHLLLHELSIRTFELDG